MSRRRTRWRPSVVRFGSWWKRHEIPASELLIVGLGALFVVAYYPEFLYVRWTLGVELRQGWLEVDRLRRNMTVSLVGSGFGGRVGQICPVVSSDRG